MLNEQKLFKTVSINDDAVDHREMSGPAIVDWARERDLSKLKLKTGARPTTFYLRTLGGLRAHNLIGEAVSEKDAYVRAFRACLVRVDNHEGHPSWEPVRIRDAGVDTLGYTLSDAELDSFHIATIYEIGAVAHGLCFFPKATGKRFALPLLSGQIWDTLHASLSVDEETTTEKTDGTSGEPQAGG